MSELELSEMIKKANQEYYCESNSIMTDNQYDILREYILEQYPENKDAKDGHTQCQIEISKNKVTLPYEMWSMDKIKPDTGAIEKWQKKYKGPYVISAKLDGISVLYSTENEEPKLYTRGNGIRGQDISYFIPYLKLPKDKNLTIRGELIISKKNFKKYEDKFVNSRNFVGGITNQKKLDINMLKDIDVVAYEIIKPELIPSEQMKTLDKLDIKVVKYKLENTINNASLSKILIDWRKDYEYEIDGIICIDDKIYPRIKGNPEHAFAFKMVLSDQVAEAKVVNVLWTPSKDGLLKPRVQIEPIKLSGATITFATGKNAKFIEENKIGVGAIIQIVRSGDVIPEIRAVIQSAPEPLFPTESYEWNETHVDIMLKDKQDNETVLEKNIAGFFKKLEVEGLGPGNITRIIEGGYNSVAKILAMSKEDFLKIEGFKTKLATKIFANIHEKIKSASLAEIMSGSNIFGRGFGEKKCILILEAIPDILTSEKSQETKIKELSKVPGMAQKTSTAFVEKIPEFIEFVKEAKLEDKLKIDTSSAESSDSIISPTQKHPLYQKKIIMTGSKDKDLLELLKKLGVDLQTAMTKDTEIVLVKDIDEDTAKANKARQLNILMTTDEFMKKYDLSLD